MRKEDQDAILQACGACTLRVGARIQTLWRGYGEIVRVHLEGSERASVVVKHVKFPPQRGHVTERSHARKVRSYEVEMNWYQNQRYRTDADCRSPACLAACCHDDEMLLVLEDLDSTGYEQRRTAVSDGEVRACLRWLARFHALFLDVVPVGLWPVGTYWHLDTRPDELAALQDPELKAAAPVLDRRLSSCRFMTIVHGDAKLANFCFSGDGQQVAALDFQYVGGGCGMKDVVYLLGSCLDERQCDQKVPGLLDFYFSELVQAVKPGVDRAGLELEWRKMFKLAWTDFLRFLLGWSPGHCGVTGGSLRGHCRVNRYSRRLCREVLDELSRRNSPHDLSK